LPVVKNSRASATGMSSTSLIDLPRSSYCSTSGMNRLPSQSSQTEATPAIIARSV
jgi:hypothetical protein